MAIPAIPGIEGLARFVRKHWRMYKSCVPRFKSPELIIEPLRERKSCTGKIPRTHNYGVDN
jgi:hypothetical protein